LLRQNAADLKENQSAAGRRCVFTRSRFLLGLLPAGILHFALVKAHWLELRHDAARSFNQATWSFSMATKKFI
jgi:hypothetical protein